MRNYLKVTYIFTISEALHLLHSHFFIWNNCLTVYEVPIILIFVSPYVMYPFSWPLFNIFCLFMILRNLIMICNWFSFPFIYLDWSSLFLEQWFISLIEIFHPFFFFTSPQSWSWDFHCIQIRVIFSHKSLSCSVIFSFWTLVGDFLLHALFLDIVFLAWHPILFSYETSVLSLIVLLCPFKFFWILITLF